MEKDMDRKPYKYHEKIFLELRVNPYLKDTMYLIIGDVPVVRLVNFKL